MIRAAVRRAAASVIRMRTRRQVAALSRVPDEPLSRVGRALAAALSDSLDEDGQRGSIEVEQLRARLGNDETLIEVTDYGAGSPSEARTAAQMSEGVVHVRPVSSIVRAAKPPFWARWMYALVRECRPRVTLEMGTSLGISTLYHAFAHAHNGVGGIHVTLEGAETIAELAAKHVAELGFTDHVEIVRGRFSDTLPTLLERLRPLSYVFVDGHHDRSATIEYWELIAPNLDDPAWVVFDDISWSTGMAQAWSEIRSDPRIRATVDLGSMGVAIVGTGPSTDPWTIRLG